MICFCWRLMCICRSSTYKGSWSPPSVKPVNSISISPFPVLFALRTGDASFNVTKEIVCVFSKWFIKSSLLGLIDDVSFFCSVLAFHRQGMQGRSFKNNEVNSTTTIDNIFSRQILCSINLYFHQRWHKRSVIGREFSSLSDPTGWLSGSHFAYLRLWDGF